MDNKKMLGIIIGIISVIVIVFVVVILKGSTKSIDIKLNEDYKSLVGITVNSDIILVIDNKNRVSNILYLNEKSVKVFANQKIEGKDYTKAIELIVDKLKNNNEFNNGEELIITKYDENTIYSNILTEINKEFVIYGVDNKIEELSSTLESKITSLNITDSTNDIKTLYNYSKKLLEN